MSLHLSWAWFQNWVARQTGMLGDLTTSWENTTVHHWAEMSGKGRRLNKRRRKNLNKNVDDHVFLSFLKQADLSLLVEGDANSATLLLSATCIMARLQAGMCHGLKLASFQSQSGVEDRLLCYSFALPLSAEMPPSSDKITTLSKQNHLLPVILSLTWKLSFLRRREFRLEISAFWQDHRKGDIKYFVLKTETTYYALRKRRYSCVFVTAAGWRILRSVGEEYVSVDQQNGRMLIKLCWWDNRNEHANCMHTVFTNMHDIAILTIQMLNDSHIS